MLDWKKELHMYIPKYLLDQYRFAGRELKSDYKDIEQKDQALVTVDASLAPAAATLGAQ